MRKGVEMSSGRSTLTDAMVRAEHILQIHSIPDERTAIFQGNRPKEKIDAIIRDIQDANADAEDE